MTHKQRRRYRAIVHILSDLSKDGWRNARPCDYQPLELELARIRKAGHYYELFSTESGPYKGR